MQAGFQTKSGGPLFINVLDGVVAELNGHIGPPPTTWDKLARFESQRLLPAGCYDLLSA